MSTLDEIVDKRYRYTMVFVDLTSYINDFVKLFATSANTFASKTRSLLNLYMLHKTSISHLLKLKEHFSAKHENTGQKTAKCNCGKKFYDLKCYLYHFKNKHGNGPRDRCPICFKKGLRETKFVLHLRSHFFKYKCDLCPKFLQIKEHLISHRSQHMREFPEPCKCKVCGNKFYDVLEYEDHMATAHLSDEKKKEASLPCASCKKVFASTDALKEHDCEDGGDDV